MSRRLTIKELEKINEKINDNKKEIRELYTQLGKKCWHPKKYQEDVFLSYDDEYGFHWYNERYSACCLCSKRITDVEINTGEGWKVKP